MTNILDGYNNLLLNTDINGEIKNIGFPTGMIVIWAGTKQNVPRGWALCDGKDGKTPDLRGQFVRMYSDDIGSSPPTDTKISYDKAYGGIGFSLQQRKINKHSINNQGGTDIRILDIKEFPKHEHKITFGNVSDWGDSDDGWCCGSPGRSPIADTGEWPLKKMVPKTTGSGEKQPRAQNNQPPYYVLSFIMKIDVTENFKNKQTSIDLIKGKNNLLLSNQIGNMISIGFPRGMIVIWAGTKTNVPYGWALCDGKNDGNTDIIIPDLRGQFVRMYSDDVSSSDKTKLESIIVGDSSGQELAGVSRTNKKRTILNHRIGDKGGSDIIVSNVNEIPYHEHDIDWGKAKEWSNTRGRYTWGTGRDGIVNGTGGALQTNTKIESVGNNYPTPQNNQPPYYVLAFIIKL